MYLTKEEERMLNGTYGSVVARCMKLLVKLGDKFEAERMVEISSAQIAGVSYKNIGDAGLEFLEGFAEEGARVKVPAFMNPAGMPLEGWEELGYDKNFAAKQLRVIEAFRKMGVVTSSTCTPYLAGLLPRFGEHIAWSESSAVSFANSVIGARTNREGGPSALAAAITGRTPLYGLHLEENRRADFLVKVDASLKDGADFGALGYLVGKEIQKGIPYFRGILHASADQLKALGASMAAYGSIAIYHVDKITPEARFQEPKEIRDRMEVTREDIERAYEEISSDLEEVDLIAIGCPHASIDEILWVYRTLNGRRLKVEMWIFASKPVKNLAERTGLAKKLGELNVKIVEDTCPVVAPMAEMGIKKVAVNSGKAAFYLPNTNKQVVLFKSVKEIVERFAE